MSAPASIVVFGVRARFGDDFEGFTDLELRRHRWQKQADAEKLKCWWQSVEGSGEDRYVLLIGDIIAHLGPEHAEAIEVAPDELVSRCKAAGDKLVRCGLADELGPPALWCQWLEDC
jgi:hypothetical protein